MRESIRTVGVGLESLAREDWFKYTETPKAPGNYKNDDKIAAYIREAEDKLQATAQYRVLTAKVTRVSFADCVAGEPEVLVLDADDNKSRAEFAEKVLNRFLDDPNAIFLTFDRELLRSLVFDYLQADDSRLPINGRYLFNNVHDPRLFGEPAELLFKRLGNVERPRLPSQAQQNAWDALYLGYRFGFDIPAPKLWESKTC